MIDLSRHFENASPEIRDVFLTDHSELEHLKTSLYSIPQDIDNPEWVTRKLTILERVDQNWRKIASRYSSYEALLYYEAFEHLWGNDETNRAELQNLIDYHGWITIPKFGAEANLTALLIAIHSDRDKEFQRRILALLEEKYMNPELSSLGGYAHLYDRACLTFVEIEDANAEWQTGVIVEKSRPQRYASQGHVMPNGVWQPFETEDFENVEARRKSMGMASLSDYFRKKMNKTIPDMGGQPICPIPLDAPPIYKERTMT